MSAPEIKNVEISCLKPHPRNPRCHTKAQIRQIGRSLKKFGFVGIVVTDFRHQILAGHARVEAARQLGWKTVPIIQVDHLSEADKLAFLIADNKLTENADWDHEILVEIFQILDNTELSLDLEVTGFDAPEIDFLLNNQASESEVEQQEDPVPPAPDPDGSHTSRINDLWTLGQHRLLCGDATSTEAYELLMGDERASFVFCDPPYNVAINGNVLGNGKARHDEFLMASGEMSDAEFTLFLERSMRLMAAWSDDGAVHDICMDWRHLHQLLTAGQAVYDKLLNIAVWTKSNGGLGSLYRSQHEMVAIFKSGTGKHVNNVLLGRNGRNRSNVWAYVGSKTSGGHRLLQQHAAVPPRQQG